MTVQERLVNAYAVLVLAKVKTIQEVPENLRTLVEIRVAQIEIEKLGGV